jgi:CHAT domain-containing protein
MVWLWKVDDLATAEIMERFYRGLLVEHLQAPAALRRAQLEMAASDRWSDPYFWPGFVIQGEWR